MAAADFDHLAKPVSSPRSFSAPIDGVAIKMSAGYNVISAEEWQEIASAERFTIIKENRAVFMSGDQSVPVRAALEWLAANLRGRS